MTRTSVLLGCDQEMLPHRLNDRERGQPVKEVDVPYRITDLPDRIAEKIMPSPDGCWLWTACDTFGYGQVYWEGIRWRAHRLSYTLLEGPIPGGLTIDHLCRIRACVNPDHLEPVTMRENVRRAPSANGEKTHCPHGHAYVPSNTYVRPSDGGRECRKCRLAQTRKHARLVKSGANPTLPLTEKGNDGKET